MDCEISAVLTNANQTTPLAQLGETKFRVSSKSWFLTYPKCPVGKTLAMELLKSKKPAKGMVVASGEARGWVSPSTCIRSAEYTIRLQRFSILGPSGW